MTPTSVFCSRKGQEIIVPMTVIKKGSKIPARHMEIARKQMGEVEAMAKRTFESFRKKALTRPGVKAEYDALAPAFEMKRQMIDLQKKLALLKSKWRICSAL